ncbi:MAG: ATP-binding protein [Planctomycetota bacterium]|nr:ATP-binding protein [Planctomycetota bacterium]
MTQHPFQFQHRPFAATPDVNNYVPTESVEASIDAVYQCVQRSAGPALVIGPTGIGKSMLCVELARRLGTPFEMVLLATSQICTRRALLQNILFELGLNFRDREEGELRLGILDHLKSPKSTSSGVLLIIDEAQTMPLKLLEEIRGLTNIQRQGQSRVHLVLAGNQKLDERLNHPKMEAFTQRIATRCYLQSLNRQDTHNFISLQWTRATGNTGKSPFSEAAIDAVYAATNGIPRLINQLCDHTLYLSSARNITDFTDELIGEAWSDLQQLPTPWQVNHQESQTTGKDSNTVVEFGELSDEVSAESLASSSPNLTPLPRADNGELDDLGALVSVDDVVDPLSEITDSSEPMSHETHATLSSTHGLSTGAIEFERLSSMQAYSGETTIATSLEEPAPPTETTLETENHPATASDANQVTHPFESDDFIEEEVVAEQKEMMAAEYVVPKSTTEPCQEENQAESVEDLELATDSSPKAVVNEIESTGALPMLPSDISFFLSQSPADGYEFGEGSIEDTVAATIEGLSSELTTELTDAEAHEASQESKAALDDIIDRLQAEASAGSLTTHEEPSCSAQQRLNETETTETSDTLEATEGCCKNSCSTHPSDVCEISHASDNATGTLGSCPTAEAIRDVTQSASNNEKTVVLPQAEPLTTENETVHSTHQQAEKSLTDSNDDKDMIVVDNPIPANALRLIGSKTRKNETNSAESEGIAFREDYQKLMHRLRGTINT